MPLNPAQERAVAIRQGPLLVNAGPGSGKTNTVTHRTAALVKDHVAPTSILLVTFTRKAAKEMRSRMSKLVGHKALQGMWVGTFHATCAKLLRKLQHDDEREGRKRDFVIYDQDDSKALIKHAIKVMKIDKKVWDPSEVQERISKLKGMGLTVEEVRGYHDGLGRTLADLQEKQLDGVALDEVEKRQVEELTAIADLGDPEWVDVALDIWDHYEGQLLQSNGFDFDDLQAVMMRLLESGRDVAQALGRKFQYVTVDEYQDTNTVQFRMIRAFARARNLCVVGDHRQSIYRFRGADVRNILMFREHYPEAQQVDLDTNYRSSPQIVSCFNAIFEDSNMVTPNAPGECVRICHTPTEEVEAMRVADRIFERLKLGTPPGEIAVLYRVHAQSRAIEERLRNAGVRYQVVGGLSFYERAEVKDVISYLRLVANPHSNIDLMRVVNLPARSVSEKTVDKLRDVAKTDGTSLWDAIPHLQARDRLTPKTVEGLKRFRMIIEQAQADLQGKPIVDDRPLDLFNRPIGPPSAATNPNPATLMTAASVLLDRSGYRTYWANKARETKKPTELEKILRKQENVEEVVSAINAYVERVQTPTLAGYLEEVALMADQDQLKDERVSLMTIHAAKGLEYDAVFVVGCEEGLLPFAKALSREDIEEERRLMFVACSRARKWLTLSLAESRFMFQGGRVARKPSRFVWLLPREVDMPESLLRLRNNTHVRSEPWNQNRSPR